MSAPLLNRYAILRIAKIKTLKQLADVENHNSRLITVENANPDKSPLNIDYRTDPKGRRLTDRYRDFLQKMDFSVRKGSVLAFEVIMTFSPETAGGIEEKQWAIDSLAFAEKRFGRENILYAKLHMDERTPHLHLVVIPVVKRSMKRRWKNAYTISFAQILGGKKGEMRERLSKLQTDYATEVGTKYGLERGIKGSKRTHVPPKKLRAYENDVNAQLSAKMSQNGAHQKQLVTDILSFDRTRNEDERKEQIRLAVESFRNKLEGQTYEFAKAAKSSWRADQYEKERKSFSTNIQSLTQENDRLKQLIDEQKDRVRSIPLRTVVEKLTSCVPMKSATDPEAVCFAFTSGHEIEIDSRTNRFRNLASDIPGKGAMERRKGGTNAIDLVVFVTGWAFDEVVLWLADTFPESTHEIDLRPWAQAQKETNERFNREHHRDREFHDRALPDESKWPLLRETLITQGISGSVLDQLKSREILCANRFAEASFSSIHVNPTTDATAIIRSLNRNLWMERNSSEIIPIRSGQSGTIALVADPLEALEIATQHERLQVLDLSIHVTGGKQTEILGKRLKSNNKTFRYVVFNTGSQAYKALITFLNDIRLSFGLMSCATSDQLFETTTDPLATNQPNPLAQKIETLLNVTR